ncbi:MAG: hypothetical protein HY077_05385 [Elusimicrobia bacterium]|nr:hypothetical protein [Elusimicrobiota bacterium]
MILWLCSWLAAASAAAPPRVADAELSPIVEAIYDVQFSSAAAAAERFMADHHGHPAGAFYRGMVAYQSYMLDETRSTAALKAFEADIAEAAALAQAWTSTEPAQGYYYLGGAEGFHARSLVAQKRFLKAASEGSRSIKHLRRAFELDPSLEDAYLGLGMYHYFRTRIPTAAKPFAFLLFGEWGNRDLGLSELERAAEKGGLARAEARSVLATIYCCSDDAQPAKAEPLLRELMARYPHNPVYRLRAAYVAELLGQWEQAAALADPDGAWVAGLEPASLRADARAAALYREAEAWVLGGKPEKVEAPLDELEKRSLPAPLVDWVLLRRANVYDSQGNRLEADRLYRAIRDPEAARAARQHLKLRYPKGPKAVKPPTGIEAPS